MKRSKTVYSILVINPGSTSTKLSLFENTRETTGISITHSVQELQHFSAVIEQSEFRLGYIQNFLVDNHIDSLHAVAGRGGLLRPIAGGVYRVNERMLDDLRSARFGEHASNLGAILAAQIAAHYHCPAYIADPVVVDEMDSVAKISGMPAIERKSIFHALNQKSAAREVARRIKKKYEACNFIVAHLGGGISVGAHCQGRVIDVNNALEGDGPFSPERSGGLPSLQLVELVLQNPQATEEIKKRIVGAGGMAAYCGTNDLKEISARIKNGDEYAALIYQAMAYQISKEIAMHGATLKGAIDGIILTGGMAKDTDLVEKIKERVSFLAPVHVICGEREMQSLAENIYAVLHEKLEAREY